MVTVASGASPSRAADQSLPIPVSGQRSSAVPICTALAPRASAAATPRPSAIPPAAMTGTRRWSTRRGSSVNSPTDVRSAVSGSNAPRCPPASIPWATIASAPGLLGGQRLGQRGGAGEPACTRLAERRGVASEVEVLSSQATAPIVVESLRTRGCAILAA